MRRLPYAALALAAVVLAIVVLSGGSSTYLIQLRLADASGLRQQSPVMIGGVQAGTVSLRLGRRDQVIADLHINRSQAPVGRNAEVAIAAVNFLGQKEIEVTRGDLRDPAPSGFTIPPAQVTVATDLDQVLDVLDSDTRARLTLLIDEAGLALTGRREDLSSVLQQLPPSLTDADTLLSQLVSDNHTLADLVSSSDRFVGEVTAQRGPLTQLVARAGQAAVTVAARRQALAATLAAAPGTLATLRTFLSKLQATTVPLRPAAQEIAQTAPALVGTLTQLQPFVAAARPALNSATAVAPELDTLAARATPVITEAEPASGTLSSFTHALQPISLILNRSVDNILAVVDNWSRAIEFRDGLSHVFRGEASVTPDVLDSVIDRMLGTGSTSSTRHRTGGANSQTHPSVGLPAGKPTGSPSPSGALSGVTNTLGSTVGKVKGIVSSLLGGVTSKPAPAAPTQSLSSLLHYLTGP